MSWFCRCCMKTWKDEPTTIGPPLRCMACAGCKPGKCGFRDYSSDDNLNAVVVDGSSAIAAIWTGTVTMVDYTPKVDALIERYRKARIGLSIANDEHRRAHEALENADNIRIAAEEHYNASYTAMMDALHAGTPDPEKP